jgi:hypothetical protein
MTRAEFIDVYVACYLASREANDYTVFLETDVLQGIAHAEKAWAAYDAILRARVATATATRFLTDPDGPSGPTVAQPEV